MKRGYVFFKQFCIVLFALISSTFSFSQKILLNTEWSYGASGLYFFEKTVVKTDINDYVYTLGSTMTGTGYDWMLQVRDDHGDSLYTAYFDGGLDDIATDFWIDNTTGYVYAVGGSVDTSAMDSLDPLIVAWDNTGAELWHTYANNTSVNNELYTSIASDGSSYFFGGGTVKTASYGYDYLVTQFDFSTGSETTSATYDYGLDDISVKTIYDGGGVYVAGISATTDTTWDYAIVLYKAGPLSFDSDYRNYAGTGTFHRPSDAVFTNNYYYVTGSVNNPLSGGYDIKTVCLDTALVVQWEALYDAPDNLNDHGNALAVASNGDVYVAGQIETNTQGKNMVLIKYDGNGTQMFVQSMNGSASLHDAGVDVEIVNNKVYVGGYSNNGKLTTQSYDTSGLFRWQKVSTISTSLYPNLALDGDGNVIIGTPYFGYLYTEKYSEYENPTTAVLDTGSNPIYKANELMISFNPNKVNLGFSNNPDKQFGHIDDVIDTALVSEMSAKMGINLHAERDAVMLRIFHVYPSSGTSMSRGGQPIPIPPFWAIMTLRLPNTVDILEAMDSLNTIDDINYAQVNPVFYLAGANDPIYNSGTSQSNLQYNATYPNANINVDSAWTNYEIGKEWVKLGVLDAGILFPHEDFGTAVSGSLTGSKIFGGFNFDVPSRPIYQIYVPPGTNVTSYYEHGTPVAGIIGALRDNSIGIAGISGGDPDSTNRGVALYDMIVCCDAGANMNASYADRLYDAIVAGAMSGPNSYNGLHIMNLSLAGPAAINNPTLRTAMLFARDNEVIMITSRGNVTITQMSNASDSITWYPACLPDDWVMSVGGSGTNGQRLTNGNSSNPDGYYSAAGRGLDFLAPGALNNVTSTEYIFGTPGTIDSYNTFGGTSVSAAHVSGVSSLMLADFQGKSIFPDNLNMEDIEHVLEYTAHNFSSPGNYTNTDGWGIINANQALAVIQKPYYGIIHFTSWLDNSSLVLTDSIITDTAGGCGFVDYSINGVLPYFQGQRIDEYKIAGTVYHNAFISPTAQILGHWIRNSFSDGYGPHYSSGGGRKVNAWTNAQFEFFTHDSARVYSYFYNGPLIGNIWHPFYPTSSHWAKLSYSVHVYDSTGQISVEPIAEDMNFNLYPNPTTETITLQMQLSQSENIKIEIYNINGQLLRTLDNGMLPAGVNYIALPVSTLASGTYFVTLSTAKERFTKKFIKQ